MIYNLSMEPGTTMIEPLDAAIDHVRGGRDGRPILEYGDYECPYSRRAFREIGRGEARLGDGVVHRGSYDAGTLMEALTR